MNEEQKDVFLAGCKNEYHHDEDQLQRQADDRKDGRSVHGGKKQRWSREQQRRAGSTQMWTLLSFSGKWDPSFLATLPKTSQPEADEEQKAKNRRALESRGKVRLAEHYARIREANKGKGKGKGKFLGPSERNLLAQYDNGTLQDEANRLTRASGNGRLRRRDGTFVDIGGSTGGFTRTVLYDWAQPDLTEFDPDPYADA
jgi:hypothetical protein